MKLASCPDIVELDRYFDGTLGSDEKDGIERHVAACSSCRERLHEIEANLQVERPVHELLTRHAASSEPLGSGGSIRGYRIISELGRGGMGIVFLAEQEFPHRNVALKVLLSGASDPSQSDRFTREANLLAQLHHPGIAKVYEAGIAEDIRGFEFAGRAFIAMEHIPGEPLDRYADHHRLDIRRKCLLLARVCDAVHHAHVNGVIHRDLKPSNILVVEHNGDAADCGAQPKILDFGVARATDADVQAVTYQTEIGQLIGTVPYMSPEQVTGDSTQVDARSDVYSLGVIGYQLFSGTLPYMVESRSLPAAIDVIRNVEPVSLSQHNTALRGDIEIIIHKALQKDVSERYQSAAEMAADLRRFLSDEPIAACPPTTLYQLRKFTRRNRGLVTAVLLIAASLILGSAAALWQARAALEARDAAQRRLAVARESSDFMLYGLGNRHARVFGGTEINRDLMEQVYSYYTRILSEQPEDLMALQNVWGALQSWAQAVCETGQRNRAEEMLLEARSMAEKAVAIEPENVAFRTHVGRIDSSLALVLRDLGALPEAHQRMSDTLQSFMTAREVFAADSVFLKVRGPYDADLEYWRKLAQLTRYLGDIRREGWNLDEANRHYGDAMPYCDELASAGSEIPFYGWREPALLLIGRGRLELARGDVDAAESHHREAIRLLENAFATDRDNPAYAEPLGQARHDLARSLFLKGRYAESARWAGRSAELSTRLLDGDEANVFYRRSLSESTALMAFAASRAGDDDQSRTAGQRARTLAHEMMVSENTGPPELLGAARVLLMIEPNEPHDAVDAARQARDLLRRRVPEYDATLALALMASGDADAALRELHAGFERIPRDAAALRRIFVDLEDRIQSQPADVDPAVLLRFR